MNNFDDKLVLKELASVIDRLDTVLTCLQQPLALSADDASAERRSRHWHKIFTRGQATPSPSNSPLQEQLANELSQQLMRLRNSHGHLQHIQTLSKAKLQQASIQLEQSGFMPPQAGDLLTRLRQGQPFHQGQLLQLLDYYQTALADSIQDGAHQQARQQELCTRLLQLIDELHFPAPVATKISKLRHRITQPLAPNELPGLCLKLIDLIIDGCLLERQHTTQFLVHLNDNLENVHRHFSLTLSEGESIFDARAESNHHISDELNAISEHVSDHGNNRLKTEIERRMRSIQHILLQHRQLQTRELALLQRMGEMDKQIQTLKDEVATANQQLSEQKDKLFIDSLTKIDNRAGMDQRLALEYRQWLRYQRPLCVALIDIDYFKEINDKYGHLAGDKALRLIAKTLQKSLRESDYVARFGGEEFVVLLCNTSPEHIEKPLQKLLENIKNIPFRFKEEPVTVTISLGATLFRQGDSIHSALDRADQALYRAKHAGRDQIVMD